MRAFLTGGLWATLIGGGALVVASVSADQTSGSQPPLPPQTEIAQTAVPAPLPETPEVAVPAALPAPQTAATDPAPEPLTAPAVPQAPAVAAIVPLPEPAPAVAEPAPAPDVASTVPPATVILSAALPVPAAMTGLAFDVAPDVPVSPPLAVVAPALPVQDQEVLIQTRPAEPAPPALRGLAGVQDNSAPPASSGELPQILPDDALPAPEADNMPAPLQDATTSLPQSVPSIRVNRPGAAPAIDAPAEAVPGSEDMSPLARYAADFDYAADLPMIAVVLLDNAMILDAPAVLSGLPFVPTIVLNASAPDVNARMRAYRDAGIEVLLQADLPQGAQPSDLETTYIAAFGLVPEAIALFSDGTGPEVTNRALADQAIQLMADEGRGFVTVPRGLGGALRNVVTDGVPVANIARELDGAGESRDAIERSLQQAALRARQSGNAVLLGRTTPDTLAAIRNWAERTDPAQIALAPVSAILLEQIAE
ncbi:divergent polysaccharide deacetylase family protein [Yoonia vestfoldensis]|uniref:divergent polysaccharide deacetylase family protein n=1 Tax=Yoonia vestfoldensis TaxID=245188 RepID=UPI0003619DEE|nr:divergent polysaccharide deacetylase family protein [Yoonia vestfoldensis]